MPSCSRPRTPSWRRRCWSSSAQIVKKRAAAGMPDLIGLRTRLRGYHRKLQQQVALDNRKIVVRDQRDDGFAARRHGARRCLPYCRSGSRDRPRSASGHRPPRPPLISASGMRRMRMAMPRAGENRRSSNNSSPGGRIVQSLTSKSSVRLTLKGVATSPSNMNERKIAGACRGCVRSRRSKRAASGEPCGAVARHSRLLLNANVLKSGGTGIGWPRARKPSLTIVEAHDLLDPLDPDVEHAVLAR